MVKASRLREQAAMIGCGPVECKLLREAADTIDRLEEEIVILNEMGQEVACECAQKDMELSELRNQLAALQEASVNV